MAAEDHGLDPGRHVELRPGNPVAPAGTCESRTGNLTPNSDPHNLIEMLTSVPHLPASPPGRGQPVAGATSDPAVRKAGDSPALFNLLQG
jgi:hypothetical protein